MVKNADGRNWIEEDKHFEDDIENKGKNIVLAYSGRNIVAISVR